MCWIRHFESSDPCALHLALKMSVIHASDCVLQRPCPVNHVARSTLAPRASVFCHNWQCALTSRLATDRRAAGLVTHAAVMAEPVAPLKKIPTLPFVKIAGQDDMKLAILLNVIDPKIGGVLIMGDRGTGKSVAVSIKNHAVVPVTCPY